MADQDKLQPQQPPEEVDLGQLFKMIGNAFDRFFRFIGSLLKGLLKMLIESLLYLRKHLVVLAVAGVLGGVIGFFIDTETPTRYRSTMVVEPNFGSTQQLYNTIRFYNDLVAAEDYENLAEALKITPQEARALVEVKIEAIENRNQQAKIFDNFIKKLDTATVNHIEYKTFVDNLGPLDALVHKVTLTATDRKLAKKIQSTILNSVAQNVYFERQKSISDENDAFEEAVYKKQLASADAFQETYRDAASKAAKKTSENSTLIDLSQSGKDAKSKELQLIEEALDIKDQMVTLREDRAKKENIINVISDFPDQGIRLKGVLQRKTFAFLWLFIAGTLAVVLLIDFNKYLERYKKEKATK